MTSDKLYVSVCVCVCLYIYIYIYVCVCMLTSLQTGQYEKNMRWRSSILSK